MVNEFWDSETLALRGWAYLSENWLCIVHSEELDLQPWSQLLENLPLPNVKWICPTAPIRPVAVLGGFPCTAWFDVGKLSEDGPDDIEGLDASVTHIANLLSTEPANSAGKLGYLRIRRRWLSLSQVNS